MEVQIDSKKNNQLLNRTEVYFTVKHLGEKTPNREIVRNELAEKLNAKKENIVVDYIRPGFGTNETAGYAKVYSSLQKVKELEETHILIRNKLIEGKKKEKTSEKKPAEAKKPTAEKTEAEAPKPEEAKEPIKEEAKQEKTEEKPEDEKKE